MPETANLYPHIKDTATSFDHSAMACQIKDRIAGNYFHSGFEHVRATSLIPPFQHSQLFPGIAGNPEQIAFMPTQWSEYHLPDEYPLKRTKKLRHIRVSNVYN
jgi:hypothetical protein